MNLTVFESDHFEKALYSMTMEEKVAEVVNHYILYREYYDRQSPPGVMVDAIGAGSALVEHLLNMGIPVVPVEIRKRHMDGRFCAATITHRGC